MNDSRSNDVTTYAIGYGLALLLTGAAFALVHWRFLTRGQALAAVFLLALVQVVVHFRFFLHIDFKRSARADLSLILFSSLIIMLMVGGSLIVLFNLKTRMM